MFLSVVVPEELELLLEELEEELEELPELELELLEELLLDLEESLLEPPFPPPPPPPQAVSIETVIAAASATAITFFANLMVNFLPHFQNRQRKSSFGSGERDGEGWVRKWGSCMNVCSVTFAKNISEIILRLKNRFF